MAPTDKQHRSDASKQKAPTDGPSADDRMGTPKADHEAALHAAGVQQAHDWPAQVLHVEVSGSNCIIVLGAGLKRGVLEEMSGVLIPEHGPPIDFFITEVDEKTSKAIVPDTIVDQIVHAQHAIINPSHKPAPAKQP